MEIIPNTLIDLKKKKKILRSPQKLKYVWEFLTFIYFFLKKSHVFLTNISPKSQKVLPLFLTTLFFSVKV